MTQINPNLLDQFSRAKPVLFTGAGFSLGAKNILGDQVPSVADLKQKLWDLCFPGTLLETESTLQHLYETALQQHKAELRQLLTASFTVDADSTPEWYASLFRLPWHKCYTLNVDDLALAVNRRHYLPRKVAQISATREPHQNRQSDRETLRVIHLNGTIEDLPDNVTFSVTQYAERLVGDEPVYAELVAELLSHPFVFTGTKLDEPPLWQHVELRFLRGGKLREFRPHSYLVTPHLDRPRQAVLANYNVEWLPMTTEEFVTKLLPLMTEAAAKGFSLISKKFAPNYRPPVSIPEVADLAVSPKERTEFLLGEEPRWSDIQTNRAVERQCDSGLWTTAQQLFTMGIGALLVVTGTAGSGKSTALMRLALHFSAQGHRVGWVDRETECTLRDIRQTSSSDEAGPVLAIDDADLYGMELSVVIRELLISGRIKLVIVGIRSGHVDRILNPSQLQKVNKRELAMPPLADEDIEALIEVLTRENRLGILQGLPHSEQVQHFRDQSGRELLVAMIQATSGQKFENKAADEFLELTGDARKLYALLAVASAFRFSLTKGELLIAIGSADNKVLNELDQLARRHIVTTVSGDANAFRARHRVIAEIIFGRLQAEGELYDAIRGLAVAAATQVTPQMSRTARPRRLLVRMINHDFLHRVLGPEQAPNLYGELESSLSLDSHYWLQRGSFELEFRNIRLAETFLNQANGLAPDDPFVQNEYAYLLFRKALENVSSVTAPELVHQANTIVEKNIADKGAVDPHPYHILGSQGLAWSRRGLHKFEEKKSYLENLRRMLDDGISKHPANQELKSLRDAIHTEYLNLALRA